MRRFDNPAAFLAGIAFRTLAWPPKTIAPLATVTDEMNQRLQQNNRLTGKRVGGHLCVVITPK
jgi:hypothetical protein